MAVLRSRLQNTSLLALIITCVSISFSSLGTLASVEGQTPCSARVPNIYDAQRQVEKYIDSGGYDRDVTKVVTAARVWLNKRVTTAR